MSYHERLAAVEAELKQIGEAFHEAQIRRAQVLRDRPCDFALVQPGKGFWVRYRTPQGPSGGYGFNDVDQSKAYRFKTQRSARDHADYLQSIHKIQVEVVEIPLK